MQSHLFGSTGKKMGAKQNGSQIFFWSQKLLGAKKMGAKINLGAKTKQKGCRIRAKDVALANPKCDPRTHGPKTSIFFTGADPVIHTNGQE
jgi:hypothetical protein